MVTCLILCLALFVPNLLGTLHAVHQWEGHIDEVNINDLGVF